jgi:hypothetical protein
MKRIALFLSILIYTIGFAQEELILDSALKISILKQLNKQDTTITQEDLEKLRILNARNMYIQSLEGLESATNISNLLVGQNNITDLSPISGLSNLRFLGIRDTKINDLGPLTNLTNLTSLYIDNCPIEDLTPLLSLSNLRILSIRGIDIEDSSPNKLILDTLKQQNPNIRIISQNGVNSTRLTRLPNQKLDFLDNQTIVNNTIPSNIPLNTSMVANTNERLILKDKVELENGQGVKIMAKILEFGENTFKIKRTEDNREFELPYTYLADSQQKLMLRQRDLEQEYKPLQLGAGWTSKRNYGESQSTVRNLQSLFGSYCSASSDETNPGKTSRFDIGINYLDTRKECEDNLSISGGIQSYVETPGFPQKSFYYYTYTGNNLPSNGVMGSVENFILVTDLSDRVIGYQLINRRTKVRLPSGDYKIYDLVQNIIKANSSVSIRYQTSISNEIINLHSYAEKGNGDNLQETFFAVHKQIGDLILYNIQNNYIRP